MIGSYFRKDLEEKVAELNAEIESLKKENDKLRTRLSKREEKAQSDPVRYQETVEELKRARVEIEALKSRVDFLKREDSLKEFGVNIRADNFYLSKKSSTALLDKIASIKASKESLITLYLRPNEKITDRGSLGEDLCIYIESLKSETGVIGFFDTEAPFVLSLLAMPPFAPEKTEMIRGTEFACAKARDIFERSRHAAFVIGHAGESFMGFATESELLREEFVTSSVMDKHSKGGWSQKRFEKLRDEDVRHHIEKASDVFSEILDEYRGITDTIVIAGDRKTATDIAGADALREYNVTYRQFETKPNRHCGDKAFKELFSARWYRL